MNTREAFQQISAAEPVTGQLRTLFGQRLAAQLTTGIYAPSAEPSDLTALRDFAAGWITRHYPPASKP